VRSRGQSASTASVAAAIAISGRRAVGSVAAIAHAIEIVRRELREVEAKEIAELERRDHDGDPGGEARGHRIGNEANETAKPRGAQREEDRAGHPRREEEAAEPEARGDRLECHHERGRRPGHLVARAAQERGRRSGDHRREEPVLRRDARCNRERHRERKCDDADDQPGLHVGAEVRPGVARGECAPESEGGERPERVLRRRGLDAPMRAQRTGADRPRRRCAQGCPPSPSASLRVVFHRRLARRG
jgi:hypothetical protein